MQELEWEGRVTLEFTIDITGRADSTSIRAVAADDPAFARSARLALLRCRFAPAQSKGRPVPVRARIAFLFTVF
jgi:TonB family protein